MLLSCPKVSIITVTFNCAKEIELTIQSIIKIKEKIDLQYIVIDGMSVDGTLDIIKKYSKKIDFYLSEPDNGIYDAMNKGWVLCNGDYILFVNAGDLLIDIPFKILQKGVKENISLVVCAVKDQNNNIILPSFNNSIKFHNTLPHQGVFYKRTIPLKYNLKYKVFSDFDINQRLYKHNYSWIASNEIVCIHDTRGISNSSIFFDEVYDIIRENFGYYYVIRAWLFHRINGLKYRYKKFTND